MAVASLARSAILVATLLLFSSFAVARATASPRTLGAPRFEVQRRHTPQLDARGDGGWSFVNYTDGAEEALIPVRNGDGALYHWLKAGTDFSKLKRIVWVCHGKGRDPWNYYNHMHAALDAAVQSNQGVNEDEVGIWSVSFWNQKDTGAFPWDDSKPDGQKATSNILVWEENGWEDGQTSIYPSNVSISSFEVLDNVVAYFANRTLFPNVDTIVMASHSMGAQMLQRYAVLGNIPETEQELHFFVGNPGAYMYLDERRPTTGGAKPPSSCQDYNDYHYGINNVDANLPYGQPTPNEDMLWARYQQRRVHYALGMADDGPGDTHCQAQVQGDSHRTRGANFAGYLEQLPGGYPKNHTLDYVPNVTHDDAAMFASSEGIFRLFVENDAQGRTRPSSLPNGLTNGVNPTFTAPDPANADRMPSGTAYQDTTVKVLTQPASKASSGSNGSSGGGGSPSSPASSSGSPRNAASGAVLIKAPAIPVLVFVGSAVACALASSSLYSI